MIRRAGTAIYDHVDARGINTIRQWTEGLGKKERAQFLNKLDRVQQVDPNSLPNLLEGPGIQGERHIYKLRLGGSGKGRALRPLLCRGPVDSRSEITLLIGAEEKDGELPDGIAEKAESLRRDIIADPQRRRRVHERVT